MQSRNSQFRDPCFSSPLPLFIPVLLRPAPFAIPLAGPSPSLGPLNLASSPNSPRSPTSPRRAHPFNLSHQVVEAPANSEPWRQIALRFAPLLHLLLTAARLWRTMTPTSPRTPSFTPSPLLPAPILKASLRLLAP